MTICIAAHLHFIMKHPLLVYILNQLQTTTKLHVPSTEHKGKKFIFKLNHNYDEKTFLSPKLAPDALRKRAKFSAAPDLIHYQVLCIAYG